MNTTKSKLEFNDIGNGAPVSPVTKTFVKMNLGILEGMQGDFDQAVAFFEELQSDFPDVEGIPRVKVLLNKGVALKDSGRLDEAEAYRVFGVLYREQGEMGPAEAQFEISIRLGKEYGNLLYLTETYFEYSRWAELNNAPARQQEYLEKSLSYARGMHGTQRAERLENALDELN